MYFVTEAVHAGHGIGWSLRAALEADLQAGTLETVLDDYVTTLPPLYLYYPEQNRRLELLRLFVDFLRVIPTEGNNDPYHGSASGRPVARGVRLGAQRDVGHRASIATHPAPRGAPPKAGRFGPPAASGTA